MITLHEVIENILLNRKVSLSIEEITNVINENKLYTRNDREPVSVEQVEARVKSYQDSFNYNNGLVALVNQEEISQSSKSVLNHLWSVQNYLRSAGTYDALTFLKTVLELTMDVVERDMVIDHKSISRTELGNTHKLGLRDAPDDIIYNLNTAANLILATPHRLELVKDLIHEFASNNKREQIIAASPIISKLISKLNVFGDNNAIHTDLRTVPNYVVDLYLSNPHKVFYNRFKSEHSNPLVRDFSLTCNRFLKYFINSNSEKSALNTLITFPPTALKRGNSDWPAEFDLVTDCINGKSICQYDQALVVFRSKHALLHYPKAVEKLIDSKHIKSIVCFPAEKNTPDYTSLDYTIVYFDFRKKHESVSFHDFKFQDDFDLNMQWQSVAKAVTSEAEYKGVSTSVDYSVLSEKRVLDPSRYLLEAFTVDTEPGEIPYRLEQIVLNRQNGKKLSKDLLYAGAEIPVIQAKDLTDNGILFSQNSNKNELLGIDRDYLDANEIELSNNNTLLIKRIGGKLCATALDENFKYLLGGSILALDIDENLCLSEFLAIAMRQDYFVKQVNLISTANGPTSINPAELLSLTIKLPSIEVQKEVVKDYLQNEGSVKTNNRSDSPINFNAKDFIVTLKHTLKQPAGALTEDLKVLQHFINKKTEENLLDFDEIMVPLEENEDKSKWAHQSLKNTLIRMDNALKDIHIRLKQADDITRIESATMELKPINIMKLIEQHVKSFKGISFDIKSSDELALINTDYFKIFLDNLINNAIKHGFSDGGAINPEISFSISPAEFSSASIFDSDGNKKGDITPQSLICLQYANNGRPLPKNFDENRFEKKSETSNPKAGDGFGGYLISQIINKHDGLFTIHPSDKLKGGKYNVQMDFYFKPVNND